MEQQLQDQQRSPDPAAEQNPKREATTGEKPLVEAAFGRRPSRRPVWFLRQAGRYLPEYQAIRRRLDFVELCRTPKMAAEVTLQPLRRFDLDGAIIFSDILIPPTALGQTLTFDKGHGPLLSPAVRLDEDLVRVERFAASTSVQSSLGYVGDAIAETRAKLPPKVTMLGFAGAPFTVACYMIEGRGSKSFEHVKRMLWQQPQLFARLMQVLVDVTLDYLAMQVEAGADAVMLFDTWAGSLGEADFRAGVWPFMEQLFAGLRARIGGRPVIYFPGQGIDKYAFLRPACEVLAVDWRVSLERAAKALAGWSGCLQGNLDPMVLSMQEQSFVEQRVEKLLDDIAQTGRSHIVNVGHGLLPSTSPQAIEWAIEAVRRRPFV